MNIKGIGQYSKATTGIRGPKKTFVDSDFKLVFVYPILISDKIPNMNSIETLIRDFLSVTFLKEIFIENTINVISMANQIRPISDENGEQVNPLATLVQVLSGGRAGSSISSSGFFTSSQYKAELQQKIKEKTAIIYQYTQSDPSLSKLRPYIEIITMGNLIDVPVIVGTKCFQVDTLSLLHILLASISLNIPLTSTANLDAICSELERLDEKKYWRLLHNLNQSTSSDYRNFFERQLSAVARFTSSLGRKIGGSIGSFFPSIQKHKATVGAIKSQTSSQSSGFTEGEVFNILRTVKTNLDQTKLFFRFVLDQKFLRSQFGLETGNEASLRTEVVTSLSMELNKVRQAVISDFTSLIGQYAIIFLRSSLNGIMPSPPPLNMDMLDLINTHVNENLLDKINVEMGKFLVRFKAILETTKTSEMRSNIQEAQEFCRVKIRDIPQTFNAQVLPGFDYESFKSFVLSLDEIAGFCSTQSKNLENVAKKLDNSFGGILMNTKMAIAESIRNIFGVLENQYFPPNVIPEICRVNPNININVVRSNLIPSFISHLTEIFYFTFLLALQSSVCKFIVLADVQLENASNEVTDWPNYTLILPIEIISALHAAIMSKGWNQLTTVSESDNVRRPMTKDELGRQNIIPVSDNYVKGIIKFVSMRLKIPNLIVIDSKKGDVYYKLMYQTSINKSKISTLETFVKSATNKTISQ